MLFVSDDDAIYLKSSCFYVRVFLLTNSRMRGLKCAFSYLYLNILQMSMMHKLIYHIDHILVDKIRPAKVDQDI